MGAMLAQWAPAVAMLALAVLSAVFFFGGLNRGQADLKERIAGVKADVGAMEARMVALFADQLRDQRRDVADVRERVSALEAAGS